MKRLREWLNRLLGSREGRRVLAGAGAGTATFLCAVAYGAGGGGHHGGDLHINWWTWDTHAPPVGWFWIDFLLFVGLLVYFLKKPMVALFQERHRSIKQAIEDAQQAYTKAKNHHDDYTSKVKNLEAEESALIEGARKDGDALRERIVADAEAYGERLRKDAATSGAAEMERAQKRLREQVVQKVVARAKDILTHDLEDHDRERLLESAIRDLENGGTSVSRGRHSRSGAGAAL